MSKKIYEIDEMARFNEPEGKSARRVEGIFVSAADVKPRTLFERLVDGFMSLGLPREQAVIAARGPESAASPFDPASDLLGEE